MDYLTTFTGKGGRLLRGTAHRLWGLGGGGEARQVCFEDYLREPAQGDPGGGVPAHRLSAPSDPERPGEPSLPSRPTRQRAGGRRGAGPRPACGAPGGTGGEGSVRADGKLTSHRPRRGSSAPRFLLLPLEEALPAPPRVPGFDPSLRPPPGGEYLIVTPAVSAPEAAVPARGGLGAVFFGVCRSFRSRRH